MNINKNFFRGFVIHFFNTDFPYHAITVLIIFFLYIELCNSLILSPGNIAKYLINYFIIHATIKLIHNPLYILHETFKYTFIFSI